MMLRDHWGYIWGTAGILWTEARQKATDNEMAEKYGSRWIGHMVTDCSGVMVYIWRQYGLTIPHGSSSMVRQGYIVDCGPDPHPGWAALVDPTPDTPDNNHIGIVGADGETVYEARGTQSGFVTSKVTDKKWTKFGRFKDVDYGDGKETGIMPEDGGTRVYYRAEVATEKGRLNVRSGPGTDYGVLFALPKGTVVDVLFEYPSGWDWISDDGDHGYVCHKYLKKVEGAAAEETPSGTETSSDAAQGEGIRTILRHKGEDHITIGLMGEWEIVGVQGDDQVERGD
ncbi:MAG: SH3 domain-containing protein [Clostridia bacterium]|nr:SH3 domain-containing protein [Clostridia bacterium]